MQHFLFKYGKPLSEWITTHDVDEYFNAASIADLVDKADARARQKGESPPGAIEFHNRFALGRVAPSMQSGFTTCPPKELQLSPSMPMLRLKLPNLNATKAVLKHAGLELKLGSATHPWTDLREGKRLLDRVSQPLDMAAARAARWWDPSSPSYWPLLRQPILGEYALGIRSADQLGEYAYRLVDLGTHRSKSVARTNLVAWLHIHGASLVNEFDRECLQWEQANAIPSNSAKDTPL